MTQFLLNLCYDGSRFHGWQVQPNAITVQETLQDAIEQILGVRENVTGCSRTDAGVHAENFYCTMRTEKAITPQKLKLALNAVLPEGVAVKHVQEIDLAFHPRYDAHQKEYRYVLWNQDYPNPFLKEKALDYPYPLDVEFLNAQAQDFLGTHDFTSFCAAHTGVEDKIRTIYQCRVEKEGDFVFFTIRGNGFLYNMVRIMVGTLLDIQKGNLKVGSIPEIIKAKDRTKAGMTVSGEGLYLHQVYYDALEQN